MSGEVSNNKIARLQDYQIARLPDYQITRLQDSISSPLFLIIPCPLPTPDEFPFREVGI